MRFIVDIEFSEPLTNPEKSIPIIQKNIEYGIEKLL